MDDNFIVRNEEDAAQRKNHWLEPGIFHVVPSSGRYYFIISDPLTQICLLHTLIHTHTHTLLCSSLAPVFALQCHPLPRPPIYVDINVNFVILLLIIRMIVQVNINNITSIVKDIVLL